MIGLIQRVQEASVRIGSETVAQIGPGLLVLVGVQRDDSDENAQRLAQRIGAYRVFPDDTGRMNLSLNDIRGELLLVPQFTLVADTTRGNRPGFSTGAGPELGQQLFRTLVKACQAYQPETQQGRFGADMQVHLVNDGPVTFWLEVGPSTAIGGL